MYAICQHILPSLNQQPDAGQTQRQPARLCH